MAAEPTTRRRSDGAPSARALLFTLLGEYVRYAGRDSVRLAAVIAGLRPLGVAEGATRRATTRLVHDGWLTTRADGRDGRQTVLVLTPQLIRLLSRWTQRLTRAVEPTPWGGEWQLLLLRLPTDLPGAVQRGWLEERLTFEGFGSLGRGLWLAADPGGVDAVAELLTDVQLRDAATFLTTRVAAAAEERALLTQAWDLPAIRPLHECFLRDFAALHPSSDEQSFAARLRLVHAWRLTFDHDPQLPAGFLPPDWPGTAARELFVTRWRAWHEAADAWWASLQP